MRHKPTEDIWVGLLVEGLSRIEVQIHSQNISLQTDSKKYFREVKTFDMTQLETQVFSPNYTFVYPKINKTKQNDVD